MAEENVKIIIRGMMMDEYMKLTNSVKNPEMTKAIYDCDNHTAEVNTTVKTVFPKLNLKAFKRGFSKKLAKVLGTQKEVQVDEV